MVCCSEELHHLVFKVGLLVADPEHHCSECFYPAGNLSGRGVTVDRCAWCEPDTGWQIILNHKNVAEVAMGLTEVQEFKMENLIGHCGV